MSEETPQSWSHGQLEPIDRVYIPKVLVDCSDWESDILAEEWSHGLPISMVDHRHAEVIEIDASGWDMEGPIRESVLEIALILTRDVEPVQLQLWATQLIEAVDAAAPDLQLTYNHRMSWAEPGRLVIVLTPLHRPDDCEARLKNLAATIRAVIERIPDVRLNGLTLRTVA